MKMVSFNLTDEQKEWLDKRSKETGAPLAALIRMAVDSYIKTINEKEKQNERISSN